MAQVAHYVDSAFNFNRDQAAFIFTVDRCVLISYGTRDSIISGPMSIADFFPSLSNTIFAYGIDAAFTTSIENEVYIFKNNQYALLNFENGNIIEGPNVITNGFPCLINTIFQDGIDAAFASSHNNDAYIFKGNQCALINFAAGRRNYQPVIPRNITIHFPFLKHTVFEGGLDAAFSTSETNQTYIFKGNTYALIYYAPGTYRISTRTPITNGFGCLEGIIPRYT